MSPKVAVIGGGLFGSVASCHLSRNGYEVHLFEKNESLLSGTTARNTNRLHLGFHYPRDWETASQSLQAASKFIEEFPKAIRPQFPNYYGLARQGSKTSLPDYRNFLEEMGLDADPVRDPIGLLPSLGFQPELLHGLWQTDETVIDVEVLAQHLSEDLTNLGVKTSLGNEVKEVARTSQHTWKVAHQFGSDEFDFVVKATYGSDHVHDNFEKSVSLMKKFEVTLVLEVHIEAPAFGLTILDGDFLTLLPKGLGPMTFLYAPGPSVLRTSEGIRLDEDFLDVERDDIRLGREQILQRLKDWLPNVGKLEVVEERLGLRALLHNVEATDARPSFVRQISANYFEIWAGKLDHSVSIAEDLVERFRAATGASSFD